MSGSSAARVAFATYEQSPELTDDDRLGADALRRHGVEVHAVVWDATDVDWDRFDLVIIRSTWDYHLKPGPYEAWVRSFLSRPNQLWNPPAVVLANLSKRYLIELQGQGVSVVPTAYVEAGDAEPLRGIMEHRGWDDVVVKPAVSASGRGTWRSLRATADEDQEKFSAESRAHDLLVQPYCPEVASHGEWSLVFLDGEWSHAVLKKPADGDFRVQRHLGGRPVRAVPDAGLVAQASAILATVGEPLLYARVDGIARGGDFVLMELELNEPFLFLSLSDGAAGQFAAAILRVLRE